LTAAASGLLVGVPCQVVLEEGGCKKKACEEKVLANLSALAAALLRDFLPTLWW
jgi:hypothetical protein